MPFGMFKGKRTLKEVPADYLLFLYRKGLVNEPLRIYIEENKKELEAKEKVIEAEKRIDMKNRYR
jgi:hypothetical protein